MVRMNYLKIDPQVVAEILHDMLINDAPLMDDSFDNLVEWFQDRLRKHPDYNKKEFLRTVWRKE